LTTAQQPQVAARPIVRRLRYIVAALLAAGSGIVIVPQMADAAAISCSTSSLIAAINTANGTSGGGTITLPSGCTFTLSAADNATDGGTGLPVITGTVTITGNGATIARSAVSGTPAFRILDVAASAVLTLDSVVLSNGLANDGVHGGGAVNSHGTLVASKSTFIGNQSPATSGTSGGAIDNSGQATITASTFSGNLAMEGAGVFNENTATITKTTFINNTATIYGGGGIVGAAGTTTVTASTFVGNTGPGGGAIDNDTTLIVSNSTFYNNTGGSNGGGAIQNFGTATISDSTLSGNTSQFGANIHNYGTSTLTISASIVANGASGSNCSGSPIADGGYNLDSGSSCGFSSANASLSNTQPRLDALASNGGPTQTMALPAASPAVDAIPATVKGCTGGTDQRGEARPQGPGCDAGAYELIVTSGDTQPPTQPTGLSAPSVTAHAVTLTWNASTDNVGVVGYTVYRNGSAVGSTGGAKATQFTDGTAAPSTLYSYAVDAFDGSGNHSITSAPISVTTPAPSGIQAVQGGAVTTATAVTQTTIPLTGAVNAGDLLLGWFGQFDSTGIVQVSDDVNGAWTRSTSTTFSSGGGDIALYYVQNAAATPFGVTVTIAASSATFLQGVASDYSGVASTGALDQVNTASGVGTSVDSGATAAVSAGELVVGGILTGGLPGSVTPGASQGQALTMRAQSASGSADLEDVLASAAGTQDAGATLGAATDWYAVTAAFHQFHAVPAATISAAPAPSTGTVGAARTFADTATVTGVGGVTPTGTVQFTLYKGSTCSGTALLSSGQIVLVAGTAPATSATYSASWTPATAGSYYWHATFTSGDSNYTSATTSCSDAGELVTVSNGLAVSQITPTAATCQQFASGSAVGLSSVTYATTGTTITSDNPGAFFYWVRVAISTAGSQSFTITQATTYAPTTGTGSITLATSGSVAYGPSCTTLARQLNGGTTTKPTVTISFSAAAAGTYFIRLKYSTASVVGSGPAFTSRSAGSYAYTFQTTGLSSSTATLVLQHR
jgi:hypothetical protein